MITKKFSELRIGQHFLFAKGKIESMTKVSATQATVYGETVRKTVKADRLVVRIYPSY
jgi:hypothetical protein